MEKALSLVTLLNLLLCNFSFIYLHEWQVMFPPDLTPPHFVQLPYRKEIQGKRRPKLIPYPSEKVEEL